MLPQLKLLTPVVTRHVSSMQFVTRAL